MKLLEAIDINGMRLPNRIVVPAMVTRLSGEDGLVNADISDRYLRFARGEPGSLRNPKLVLLINDSQPQFFELHPFVKQRVRADDNLSSVRAIIARE